MSDSENIRELYRNGRIGFITIDTSILIKYIHEPNTGMCKQLKIFYNHGIPLIISSIIKNELIRHKYDEYRDKKTKAETQLKALEKSIEIGVEIFKELEEKINLISPYKQACELLDDFTDTTECEFIEANDVQIGSVFEKYFKQEPPFGENEKKKNEFPDAFALMSLENLAESQSKQAIVLSSDKDWATYCNKSVHLICLTDLSGLIALFDKQDAVENLKNYINKRLSVSSDYNYFKKILYDEVNSDIEKLTPFSDSQSSFRYELTDEYLELASANFPPEIMVLSLDKKEFSFEVNLELDIIAHASFSFYVKDGIEYANIGSNHSIKKIKTYGTAVITIDFDEYINYEEGKACVVLSDLLATSLEDLYITNTSIYLDGFDVDHGEVEPSFINDCE